MPFNPNALQPDCLTSYCPVPSTSLLCAQAPNATCPLTSKACGFSLTYTDSLLVASLSQSSLAVANDVIKAYASGTMFTRLVAPAVHDCIVARPRKEKERAKPPFSGAGANQSAKHVEQLLIFLEFVEWS
jgi:hypothetical protein